MPDPERLHNQNETIESWRSSQLSAIWEPKALYCNSFLVSIDYPQQSLTHLLGYIELERFARGQGGLFIPLKLPDTHRLSYITKNNLEKINAINPEPTPENIAEIIKKQQFNSHDLVHIYQDFGFPMEHDDHNGFCPDPVNGFTLNFAGISTGAVNLWIYRLIIDKDIKEKDKNFFFRQFKPK